MELASRLDTRTDDDGAQDEAAAIAQSVISDSSTSRLVTPEDYAKSIFAHSRRSIANSIYPGENYTDFAQWLQHRDIAGASAVDEHVLAVLYKLGREASNRSSQWTNSGAHLRALEMYPRPERGMGQVLFLRGFPAANWIKSIGSKYRVDPEFIHRHLGFFATSIHRSVFALPSLPSTASNIIKLTITTILVRTGSVAPRRTASLEEYRREEADRLTTYHRQLLNQARPGDSIVRDYAVLDEDFAVVEQSMSICVNKNADGWIAIIWSDLGRDLKSSPSGPWINPLAFGGQQHGPFPTIQHHPKMTLQQKSQDYTSPDYSLSPYPTIVHDAPSMHQSASLLPFDYDCLIDIGTARQDPLYAVNNIFRLAAFSEVQFLNLMERMISKEMGILKPEHERSHSLADLQYFKTILDRHANHIRSTLDAVKSKIAKPWSVGVAQGTAMPKPSKRATIESSKLVEDYTELLRRAEDLCVKCTEGMGVMMNRASIAESRKAIEQADRLRKLTLLASFFIPLSFTTSFFGMNFVEFDSGVLPLWLFVAVSAPIVALSYMFYVWDIAELSKVAWLKTYKSCKAWYSGRRSFG